MYTLYVGDQTYLLSTFCSTHGVVIMALGGSTSFMKLFGVLPMDYRLLSDVLSFDIHYDDVNISE